MPVEIVQFCWKYNLERLQQLPELAGATAKLRMTGDKPYVSDNSNYIVDLYFEEPIKDAHAAAKAISALTGRGRPRPIPGHGGRVRHCRLRRRAAAGEVRLMRSRARF